MDRRVNRINEACIAAERIINMIESAGFNIADPHSIIYGAHSVFPEDMQYAYGASRLVVWDEDYCDYVIKIALDEGYEKYCQHEVEIYEASVREGLSDKFAWCMCYSEPYKDDDTYHPGIYVMEYVDCNEEVVYDSAWKYGYESFCEERGYDSSSYDAADEYNDWNWSDDDDMVLDYMTAHMDVETQRAFNVFMMKWNITDIHTANAGFKGNKMVITDYAGWNWQVCVKTINSIKLMQLMI